MLRNKLFFIILSVVTVTLAISGTVYYKNINEIFQLQIKKEIKNDEKQLLRFFDNTKSGLYSLVNEINKSEDLKASLNLISLYEDPNDYVKETFDYEKEYLAELSKKWIKDNSHYSIALFNNELELVMINRNLHGDKVLGYSSYESDNKRVFIDYNSKEQIDIKTPFIKNVNKSNINKFQLNFYLEKFLLSYLKPVYLDGMLIGYLKVTSFIDHDLLKELNDATFNLKAVLFDQKGNYIYPSQNIKSNFESMKGSSDYEFLTVKVLGLNNDLYAGFIIDKIEVNKKLNEVLVFMLELWVIILVVLFTLSAYFINRSILTPINNLKTLINDIKKGKYTKKLKSGSNNEISQIVNDFHKLSIDLSKNISFLESYELAMDRSSIVTKSDLKGKITYVNDNFYKVTGYTKDEVLGKPHSIIRHPDTPKEVFKDLWETIHAKKVWKGIIKNRGKLDDYWVDTTILPILDENNDIVEYIAVRHDITQMVQQQEKLDNIANTDTLTGLGNRYKLMNDIKNSISPALAILNIDNFSLVNDFYGHETGDDIIRKIALELFKITKNDECEVYHLQGDEYVIFNSQTNNDHFLEKIEIFIRELSKIEIDIDEEELNFNFSIGVSFENRDNILSTADMALKIAKKDNESLKIYNEKESLNKEYENNIKWTKKIKEAIENDNIVPVFQPIVNNSSEAWEKYESLVRLKDEDKLISPYFFLDISKKTKHYNKITKIMIEKSFEVFRQKDCEFSINLTIEDILNSEIKSFIFTILEKYQIGERVVFEIVESESIENFEEVLKFIEDIKSYKCKVAIDDFGTGYSNFEYLMKLKADYIKIDGSMIKDIDENVDAQLVVATIVDFAKKMGMKTIAEFVENESVLKKVKELDIDYSQGYHFSAPKQTV